MYEQFKVITCQPSGTNQDNGKEFVIVSQIQSGFGKRFVPDDTNLIDSLSVSGNLIC